MSVPILHLALLTERDVVQSRQRAREIAAALGLDNQDQIRMATATSEIARNAFPLCAQRQSDILVATRTSAAARGDGHRFRRPAFRNLDQIFEARYKSETGLGMGIIGTKRLMDEFEIESSSNGTVVRMAKCILTPSHDTWTLRTARDLAAKCRSASRKARTRKSSSRTRSCSRPSRSCARAKRISSY